ncbi:MAG: porin [Steroidobacterales bacterium]
MINGNSPSEERAVQIRGKRSIAALGSALVAGTLMATTSVTLAADSGAPPPPVADQSLTWHGITLYGIIDIGLQYENHGAPISDYFPAGANDVVQKNSLRSVFGATPSNMSQSRIGLSGKEPLGVGDWSAVFRAETYFNPQSGDLSDGLKALTQQNGKALSAQTTGIDTSVAGIPFEQSYAGVSSPTFGTLTFGRQNTLLADAIAKYDPQGASQAFSLIGLSGVTAGGGDTQDRRLDSSLKYVANFSGVHVGAQYKFNGANGGSANTAMEFQLGGEYAGLSADAYYVKTYSAISVGSLSAAQVAGLPALGYSSNNSLAGTISDNTTYAIDGMYDFGAVKLFAAYEHIQYANPRTPLAAGFNDIGGYVLAFVNTQVGPTSTYANDKILQVYWGGVKYTVASKLDLVASYYGYHQNSFATGANAGCSTNKAGNCSGIETAIGVSADYRWTKRFDTYAGLMYTGVKDGLANGFANTSSTDPTIGVRFKF